MSAHDNRRSRRPRRGPAVGWAELTEDSPHLATFDTKQHRSSSTPERHVSDQDERARQPTFQTTPPNPPDRGRILAPDRRSTLG
jgi:hypothetical protein